MTTTGLAHKISDTPVPLDTEGAIASFVPFARSANVFQREVAGFSFSRYRAARLPFISR